MSFDFGNLGDTLAGTAGKVNSIQEAPTPVRTGIVSVNEGPVVPITSVIAVDRGYFPDASGVLGVVIGAEAALQICRNTSLTRDTLNTILDNVLSVETEVRSSLNVDEVLSLVTRYGEHLSVVSESLTTIDIDSLTNAITETATIKGATVAAIITRSPITVVLFLHVPSSENRAKDVPWWALFDPHSRADHGSRANGMGGAAFMTFANDYAMHDYMTKFYPLSYQEDKDTLDVTLVTLNPTALGDPCALDFYTANSMIDENAQALQQDADLRTKEKAAPEELRRLLATSNALTAALSSAFNVLAFAPEVRLDSLSSQVAAIRTAFNDVSTLVTAVETQANLLLDAEERAVLQASAHEAVTPPVPATAGSSSSSYSGFQPSGSPATPASPATAALPAGLARPSLSVPSGPSPAMSVDAGPTPRTADRLTRDFLRAQIMAGDLTPSALEGANSYWYATPTPMMAVNFPVGGGGAAGAAPAEPAKVLTAEEEERLSMEFIRQEEERERREAEAQRDYSGWDR